MNIIAVDDERPALWTLEQAINNAKSDADLACFLSANDALEYAYKNIVDVAFLDIQMDEINGLILAKKLKNINPLVNIIFISGYNDYMADAFDMIVSGYVMKPINPDRIILELENLRYPVKSTFKGLRIQCFGNFEVFMDGVPVEFKRLKSKEALAYLVDRKGASVNKKTLASVLIEDKQYTRSIQSYIHIIVSEMIHSLENVDSGDIIIKKHNSYAVDPSKFSCDFYSYENGEPSAINGYRGEYMTNYSWAEFTTGQLEDMPNKNSKKLKTEYFQRV